MPRGKVSGNCRSGKLHIPLTPANGVRSCLPRLRGMTFFVARPFRRVCRQKTMPDCSTAVMEKRAALTEVGAALVGIFLRKDNRG